MAEASNLELRAARQQRAMAVAGLQTAGAVPNPSVSFSASRDAPHEGLLWDQPIELGGKRGKRIAVAREEQKATELDIAALSLQVRRRTRQAFYEALTAHAQTEQSKAALELATRIHDIVRQRYDAGDVAELEVIQAAVEQVRADADYEATAQAEKSADAELAALLNLPLDQPRPLDGKANEIPSVPPLDSLNQTAMRSNADIQKTTQDMAVEQRRLALARSERIPDLALQAGVDLNAPGDYRVGPRGQLGITLPLFYHGQGEIAASSARLEFLRLSLQSLQTNATAGVMAAYYDYLAKSRQAQDYQQKIVPQTVRLENMAEESYRAGKSNLLTLIDAQRKLNDTQKAYLDSLLAAQNSFAAMEEVVGAPLD